MLNFRKGHRQLRIALGVLGVSYPILVYVGLRYVPPGVLIVVPLLALGVKYASDARREAGEAPISRAWWLAGSAVLLLMIAAGSSLTALKSYPVLVSLGFAVGFGHSLLRPPTVVERIARLHDPDLPAAATPYLRSVTVAWFNFFLANATISVATTLSGSLALWALYNGFISYLIMGALFVGELALRRFLRPGGRRA